MSKVGGKVVQDGEVKYPKSISARMVAEGSGEEMWNPACWLARSGCSNNLNPLLFA
jgi:hypothetical protein